MIPKRETAEPISPHRAHPSAFFGCFFFNIRYGSQAKKISRRQKKFNKTFCLSFANAPHLGQITLFEEMSPSSISCLQFLQIITWWRFYPVASSVL
jgi:hypothetical protein